ncbi:DUF4286 family protein [Myxococcota bacterium]|nr:DUF4286 family protein [Myxococcota bacterium]
MSDYIYTVRCTLLDEDVARRWLRWLQQEHLAQVCAAGALSAEVIRLEEPGEDQPGVDYEVRYRFASGEALDLYLELHAPRLREEGLARFPLELGLRYRRSWGPVVGRWPG